MGHDDVFEGDLQESKKTSAKARLPLNATGAEVDFGIDGHGSGITIETKSTVALPARWIWTPLAWSKPRKQLAVIRREQCPQPASDALS